MRNYVESTQIFCVCKGVVHRTKNIFIRISATILLSGFSQIVQTVASFRIPHLTTRHFTLSSSGILNLAQCGPLGSM